MRLELTIRPDAPVARDRFAEAGLTWLRDAEKRGADLVGTVATSSAEARLKPTYASGADGALDRERVASIAVALDFSDPSDVEALVEGAWTFASALGSSLCALDGTPLDRESTAVLFHSCRRHLLMALVLRIWPLSVARDLASLFGARA